MPRALRRKIRKTRKTSTRSTLARAYRRVVLELFEADAGLDAYGPLQRCDAGPMREALLGLLRDGEVGVLQAPGFIDYCSALDPTPVLRRLRAMADDPRLDVDIRAEVGLLLARFDAEHFQRRAAAEPELVVVLAHRRAMHDLYRVEKTPRIGSGLVADRLAGFGDSPADEAVALFEALRRPLGIPAGQVYVRVLIRPGLARYHDAIIELLVAEADIDGGVALEVAIRKNPTRALELQSALTRLKARRDAGQGAPRPRARAWMGPADMDGSYLLLIAVDRPSGGPVVAVARLMVEGGICEDGDVLCELEEAQIEPVLDLMTRRGGQAIEIPAAEAATRVGLAVVYSPQVADREQGIAGIFRRASRPGDPPVRQIEPGVAPDEAWLVEQLDALDGATWSWHPEEFDEALTPSATGVAAWREACRSMTVGHARQIAAAARQLAQWHAAQGRDDAAERWAAAGAVVEVEPADNPLVRAILTRSEARWRAAWAEGDQPGSDQPGSDAPDAREQPGPPR